MPGRRWRSWKDWTVSSGCGTKGTLLLSQEAPPSPVFLRNGHGRFPSLTVLPSGANGLGEHWTAALEPLDSRATNENDHGMITDGVARAGKPKATSARKPTFLQRERWKAIQKAQAKGDVASSNRAGIGNPPGHHQEIPGGRGSSNATIQGGSHGVII